MLSGTQVFIISGVLAFFLLGALSAEIAWRAWRWGLTAAQFRALCLVGFACLSVISWYFGFTRLFAISHLIDSDQNRIMNGGIVWTVLVYLAIRRPHLMRKHE